VNNEKEPAIHKVEGRVCQVEVTSLRPGIVCANKRSLFIREIMVIDNLA
jgi:hypothetical protein